MRQFGVLNGDASMVTKSFKNCVRFKTMCAFQNLDDIGLESIKDIFDYEISTSCSSCLIDFAILKQIRHLSGM